MTTADGTWPFVGRDTHVARIAAEWAAEGRGVFVEGLPGMGKTRLADEAAAAISAPRVRIVGNPASRTRPYAAVAHLIGDAHTGDAVSALSAALPSGRCLLVIDEATALDDATLAAVNHLLSGGRVMVIASGRIAVAVPPALGALIRGHRLALVEVGPLSADDVHRAVTAVVGEPLDNDTLHRLMALSGGNPLFARELVATALEQGAVRRLPSGARLEFDAPSNLRLLEVVGERIGDLDPAAVGLLRLISVAETVGVDDLERIGQLDRAGELEQRGLLRVDLDDLSAPGGTVRIAHPLHQEVLSATMGKLERRRQIRRALDVMQQRRDRSDDDDLRMAVWQLELGETPAVDVVVRGARRARAAMDLPSTLRLASAADAVRPAVGTQTLIMEVLFLQGDFAASEEAATRPLPDHVSAVELFTSTAIRMDNLVWGFGDATRAITVAEERRERFVVAKMEPLLDGLVAYVSAVGGHVRQAEQLLAVPPADAMTALLTAPARATTLDRAGRLTEAIAAADRALEVLSQFPEPKAVMDPASFQVSRGLTLLALGRFDDARRDALAAYSSVVRDGVPFLRAFLPMVLGRLALAQGATDDARAWFTESRTVADEAGVRTAERVAIAGLAAVAGQRGDVEACADLLDTFEALDDPLGLMRVETAVGRAWALAAVGRLDEARTSLRTVVADRIDEEPSPSLWALVELARLGDASWAADRLAQVAAVDGPFAAVRCEWVRGVATGNVARLAAAVDQLEALGAHPLVAEGASVLAGLHARAGDQRLAGAAQAQADRAIARCQGLHTPLLAAGSHVPLSSRERDVALLAAAGRTSKDIANELHLSIRTVDNHLSRTYVKLGISRRSELAAALARHPDGG